MAHTPTDQIVAITPAPEQSAEELREVLIEELDHAGLPYVHVGAGTDAAYVVLPDDRNQRKLSEIVASSHATLSGAQPLRLEKYGFAEGTYSSIEQLLEKSPIDYDIPIDGGSNDMLGVCSLCGGIGRHLFHHN